MKGKKKDVGKLILFIVCLFREILVQYDLTRSNNSQTYLPDTSSKVYSQDFQTVYSFRDLYGHNEVQL
jgi:hypothetical protein